MQPINVTVQETFGEREHTLDQIVKERKNKRKKAGTIQEAIIFIIVIRIKTKPVQMKLKKEPVSLEEEKCRGGKF